MKDHDLIMTEETAERLAALRYKTKFMEDTKRLYPGAPDEQIRQRAETAVNAMLDRLRIGLQRSPRKSYVLSEFAKLLKDFDGEDSEEKEEACEYCEEVMALLGIESSDGMLNTWLYGFDPDE